MPLLQVILYSKQMFTAGRIDIHLKTSEVSDIDLFLSVPVNIPLYLPVALACRKEETMTTQQVE